MHNCICEEGSNTSRGFLKIQFESAAVDSSSQAVFITSFSRGTFVQRKGRLLQQEYHLFLHICQLFGEITAKKRFGICRRKGKPSKMVHITHAQEKRILLVTGVFTVLGIILMIVVISTDYWVILTIPTGSFRPEREVIVTGHHSGLWRLCIGEIDNKTEPQTSSKFRCLFSNHASVVFCIYSCTYRQPRGSGSRVRCEPGLQKHKFLQKQANLEH